MHKGKISIPFEQRMKISESVRKYRNLNPMAQSTKEKLSLSVSQYLKEHPRTFSERTREKISLSRLETKVGGFWYGNQNINPTHKKYIKKYCELWDEDLKERIRAYWYYVSALSGKEETSKNKRTNKIYSIACHHVYYQPKACCVWDEDENGYYANINQGTWKRPNIIKYYIDGDPNKFVTLTRKEHKKTDFGDRIKWIKTFEKIIEDQGGKCYFTKEEAYTFLINGDT